MKKHLKFYRLFLMKAYFDAGYGFTGYLKYMVALFGISSLNVKNTIILGSIYGVLCFIIGFVLYNYGLIDTINEINNQYNPFAKQVRTKFKIPKSIKTIKY